MRLKLRSLEARLALRLALVLAITTGIVVAVILYQGSQAADELSNEQLLSQANALARAVTTTSVGQVHLALSPAVDARYRGPSASDLFLIQDVEGRAIASSSEELAQTASELPLPDSEPHFFRLEQFGPGKDDYYGLRLTRPSVAGSLVITVMHASDADALANALLRSFVRQIAWSIPIFAAATLAIGVWSIRRGLRPLRTLSERAAAISPATLCVRLPTDNLPREIEPLVAAVNQALDRLQEGFAVQRQFTANAAHELRTPLAVLTAGLENLEHADDLAKLRGDATRMNRLVDQLLRVARLDALPLDVRTPLDLGATVADVVEYMAPWAVSHGRRLGFEWPDQPVLVRGNADALADAVRNLIENAVCHTPSGSEVAVSVSRSGAITVADHGPGVAPEDRPHVFDRFWRGPRARGAGAGLGLAIVAEVAAAHDGSVEIDDVPGGGALFTLRLKPDRPTVKKRQLVTQAGGGGLSIILS